MTDRERFLQLGTPQDLADMLDVSVDALTWNLWRNGRAQRYVHFTVPKRGGGTRLISAPNLRLKQIQQRLAKILRGVYHPRPAVHGFSNGRGILSNAQQHQDARYVLNIDLVDFFDTINFGRVRGVFLKAPYSLPPAIATYLAQLCCHDGHLPQGAPTSPSVSNMVCWKLDGDLQKLANRYGCVYSRYADDITFSKKRGAFPAALATSDGDTTVLGDELLDVVSKNGFQVNERKTRLQTQPARQIVTGLVVNGKPNVQQRYLRRLRAMLYAWQRWGIEDATKEHLERYRTGVTAEFKKEFNFEWMVMGHIAFLSMVRGKHNPQVTRYREWFARLSDRGSRS